MRYLLLVATLATACADLPEYENNYDSVHERLSKVPTWVYVRDEASIGAIAARRRLADGWLAGATTLSIEHGHARTSLDDSGRLSIDQLEIALAPISLARMLDKPAELHDVRIRLGARTVADPMWESRDDATASFDMHLDFDWALALEGGEPTPLATQHLAPTKVDVVLAGNGDTVDLHLAIDASGALWNWADSVEITDVTLSITARSN
jgi:hypothetical protein